MKTLTTKIINTKTNKEFQCMLNDAELLLNMLEQAQRGWAKETDYIQPGLCAGQTKMDIVEETTESINQHLKNLRRDHKVFY